MHLNKKNVYNRETSAKPGSHFYLCTSFKFISALLIGRRVLDYLCPITTQLQKRANDILCGYDMVNCLKDTIRIIVNNMDEYHNKWYADILALAESLDVNRDNPPSNTATEYYKRSISIPLVNHLQTQLNDRFTESITVCVNAFKIVPGVMLSPLCKHWRESFLEFFYLYINDMPSPFSIEAELEIWHNHWSNYH